MINCQAVAFEYNCVCKSHVRFKLFNATILLEARIEKFDKHLHKSFGKVLYVLIDQRGRRGELKDWLVNDHLGQKRIIK